MQYADREWEVEEILRRNAAGAQIPIPEWYENRKEVPNELRWFWHAFWELDTCRNYIDGVPARIPWTATLTYAEYHQIDFDYLWHLIVVLDSAYISYRQRQHKEEIDRIKREANQPSNAKRRVRNGRR